ncbi:hypothetical protein [Nitratireductor rhodophyticola]
MNRNNANDEETTRELLRRLVADFGGPTAVATLSGVPLPSLKRYISGATRKIPLEVLEKVATACAVPVDTLIPARKSGLIGEAEPFAQKVASLQAQRPWTMRARSLDLAGVLPGDLMWFAENTTAGTGDVVLAQLSDDDSGSVATIVRQVRGEYLLTRSSDPESEQTPISLNDKRLQIVGVLVDLRRLVPPKRS